MGETLDKHQLAGLDARERGFSRPVVFEQVGEVYRAILRYETILLETEPHSTQDDALRMLIQTLQSQGYRQLRTQMAFAAESISVRKNSGSNIPTRTLNQNRRGSWRDS